MPLLFRLSFTSLTSRRKTEDGTVLNRMGTSTVKLTSKCALFRGPTHAFGARIGFVGLYLPR